MCYTKIEAFKDSDGKLHPDEKTAIVAELTKLMAFNDDDPVGALMANASEIVVLLQRSLVIAAPTKSINRAPPKTAGKDPGQVDPGFAKRYDDLAEDTLDDLPRKPKEPMHGSKCGTHSGFDCDCKLHNGGVGV